MLGEVIQQLHKEIKGIGSGIKVKTIFSYINTTKK